jgi:hypothetical protein
MRGWNVIVASSVPNGGTMPSAGRSTSSGTRKRVDPCSPPPPPPPLPSSAPLPPPLPSPPPPPPSRLPFSPGTGVTPLASSTTSRLAARSRTGIGAGPLFTTRNVCVRESPKCTAPKKTSDSAPPLPAAMSSRRVSTTLAVMSTLVVSSAPSADPRTVPTARNAPGIAASSDSLIVTDPRGAMRPLDGVTDTPSTDTSNVPPVRAVLRSSTVRSTTVPSATAPKSKCGLSPNTRRGRGLVARTGTSTSPLLDRTTMRSW